MAFSTIDKHTNFFSKVFYTGNYTDNHSITGVGFQPDLVWLKERSSGSSHDIQDVVRGAGKDIYPDIDAAEETSIMFKAFESDGFAVGQHNLSNQNGETYVAWNWKLGTSSGIATDGETDITPTAYSFNATSGISTVKYTGTGTSGEGVPHGLGAKPQFIIVKRLDTTGAWTVFHQPQLNVSNATKFFEMHNGDAEATNNNRWNGWQPDTINFYLGDASEVNASGGTYVAYVFAAKSGFSQFGKYQGNGDADGAYIWTGFKPKFVMCKATNTAEDWGIWGYYPDYNLIDRFLYANSNVAESTGIAPGDFLSNGFKLRTTDGKFNSSGNTYLYVAFGQTIVGSNNIPATAR